MRAEREVIDKIVDGLKFHSAWGGLAAQPQNASTPLTACHGFRLVAQQGLTRAGGSGRLVNPFAK
jgi:hypothetical protein